VFDREQDIIAKDLRAVQATLTLMTSAIQTLGQDPNSPDTHTRLNQDGSGACPCGCGRRGPSRFTGGIFARLHPLFSLDPRRRTYEKFEEQQRAEESRRQREVDEDELLRNEERSKREREKQRSREEAEAHARDEREAREHLREQARRRWEEETGKRDEDTRRRREDEERRRAEADRRAREEEERKKREEEETRKRKRGAEKTLEDMKRKRDEGRRRIVAPEKKRKSLGREPRRKRGAEKTIEDAKRKSLVGERKDGATKARISRIDRNSNTVTMMEERMRKVQPTKMKLRTTTALEERAAIRRLKGGPSLSSNAGISTRKRGVGLWPQRSQDYDSKRSHGRSSHPENAISPGCLSPTSYPVSVKSLFEPSFSTQSISNLPHPRFVYERSSCVSTQTNGSSGSRMSRMKKRSRSMRHASRLFTI